MGLFGNINYLNIFMTTLATTSSALFDLLLNEIHQQPDQLITFATYMELLLYAPEVGYYARTPDRIGSRGDFFTSPHLGIDFGEMLAIQLAEMWELLDKPQPFTVVEMGAGQGLLAKDILNYWQQQYPELIADYVIVETSAAMRRCQQQVLMHQSVRWVEWTDLPSASITGCLFSNELIDAFPVHQVVVNNGILQEVYVTIDHDNQLQEVLGTPSTPRLLEYFEQAEIPILSYEDGYRTEVNLAAIDWLQTVSSKLNKGYLLSIDYGYTSQRYYNPQRSQGTLQCYYQHRYHSNPYINIGQQDLTTHVDFTSLIRQGNLWGLRELGFTKQGMFLMSLGLADRISQPETLERRQALHQLIEPMGLGGFGVLLQEKNMGDQILRGFRN
jgi:SAM-dependent MidA family methyltransferase